MDSNLPKGFISAEKAIQLINKHTAKKPLVDIDFLMNNASKGYPQAARNFTIFLLQKNDNGYERGLQITAVVKDLRERENLRYAITQKYEQVHKVKIDLKTAGLRDLSTQVDDLKGETSAMRPNDSNEQEEQKAPKAPKTIKAPKA